MSRKKHLVLIVLTLTIAIASGQTPSPPDFSGNWILVEGDPGANSPLRNEGEITQDGSSVTFRWSNQLLRVPFDGSKTTRADNVFTWEYEGRWAGFAYVVSMKGSTGRTPGHFEDLMVVSLGPSDTLTIMMIRTTLDLGKAMKPYTLKYKKA